jgi:anti-sigma B factor antagonist
MGCGLTVPYKTSGGDTCPRCLVRENRAVALIPVGDEPSRGAIGRLRMLTRVHGERHVIVLSGELDIASAQMLEATLEEACSAGATELVLDLAGIEFMDSTGLRAILRGRTLCEEHHCGYRLTPAQRPVERTLEVTGLPRSRLRVRRFSKRHGEGTASG